MTHCPAPLLQRAARPLDREDGVGFLHDCSARPAPVRPPRPRPPGPWTATRACALIYRSVHLRRYVCICVCKYICACECANLAVACLCLGRVPWEMFGEGSGSVRRWTAFGFACRSETGSRLALYIYIYVSIVVYICIYIYI